MKVETYPDIQKELKNKGRDVHLLLGNGFSMAYDAKIFSYNALHRFIMDIDNELLSKLFEIVNTNNFELVMQQLDNFSELVEALGADQSLRERIDSASSQLKESLINAIKELHPEHVFMIPNEKSESCASFLKWYLKNGGKVFTTNYDILLYWVLLRNEIRNSIDGFSRERENPDGWVTEEELEYSELRWGKHKEDQTVFYLHGALPIFDTGIDVVKEEYDSEHFLLQNISERLERKEYPIFVTAGNDREKLTYIMHNQYLAYCYEQLTKITGSLVTYGFNFGEYDTHIIDAINKAAKHGKKSPPKLWSIYLGVYSEQDREHIESIVDYFDCKVHIFDARSANVWSS